MNSVSFSGRIISTVELKESPTGVKYVHGALSVMRGVTSKQAGVDANYMVVRFVCFRYTAELFARNFKKGDAIEFCGYADAREYEVNGQKRTDMQFIAERVYWSPRSRQQISAAAESGAASNVDPWGTSRDLVPF